MNKIIKNIIINSKAKSINISSINLLHSKADDVKFIEVVKKLIGNKCNYTLYKSK